MSHTRLTTGRMLLCALTIALLASSTPSFGIVSTFTGGDPGEGLDLNGSFLYAINVHGPGGFKVGDAFFTTDQNNATAGWTHNATAQIINWANPNLGASTNDNNLEVVMQSIRHLGFNGTQIMGLTNLVPGRNYKLQLLYTESCCNRGFDISVNGNLVENDFNIPNAQGGINGAPTNGVVVTHSFTAVLPFASIAFDGLAAPFPDKNPTLSGLTLEDLSGLAATNVALQKPATATSIYPAGALFDPSKAVDGVTNDAQGFQWLSVDGVQPASLTIDLLGDYDISEFQLLNTANAGFADRETATFSIDVAGSNGIFRNVIGPKGLQDFVLGFQNELVNLNGVHFIRYNMLTFGDPPGGLVSAAGGGLNELRAIGVLSIPEPATAMLGLLGVALLGGRRRRVA